MSRPIKELLEITLENEQCYNNEGLCTWFSMLCRFQLIDYREMIILINYAKANKPIIFTIIYTRFIHRNNGFWWKKGNITPRIKWIKKHIKKNS
jgi:hypothetical protein